MYIVGEVKKFDLNNRRCERKYKEEALFANKLLLILGRFQLHAYRLCDYDTHYTLPLSSIIGQLHDPSNSSQIPYTPHGLTRHRSHPVLFPMHSEG